jgi:hypothetical protein
MGSEDGYPAALLAVVDGGARERNGAFSHDGTLAARWRA